MLGPVVRYGDSLTSFGVLTGVRADQTQMTTAAHNLDVGANYRLACAL
jgi:hypothetical protein